MVNKASEASGEPKPDTQIISWIPLNLRLGDRRESQVAEM